MGGYRELQQFEYADIILDLINEGEIDRHTVLMPGRYMNSFFRFLGRCDICKDLFGDRESYHEITGTCKKCQEAGERVK